MIIPQSLKRNSLDRILSGICERSRSSSPSTSVKAILCGSLTGLFAVVGAGVGVAAVEGEEALLEGDVERADLLLALLALLQVVDGAATGEAVARLGFALALAVEPCE